jgi:hypothetical protein
MSSHPSLSTNAGSNLLQTMLDKIQLRWEGSLSPPPPEIFSIIGDLTFLQLSTLRHRGAFSTVSLTFTKCCLLTQVEPQTASSALDRLQLWYEVCDRLATSPILSYTVGCLTLRSGATFNYQKIGGHTCPVHCYYGSSGESPLVREGNGRADGHGLSRY